MKVLQFGKFYPPHIGGIEKVMFDLTEGLNRRGIECDVLCSNKQSRYAEDTSRGYSVIRTPSYGIYHSVSLSPQMITRLRRVQGGYDIIHIHLPDPMAALALYIDRPEAALVLHWHGDVIRQRMMLPFYRPFQTYLLKRGKAILATSPNYIEGSESLAPFKAKCHVVPIGVDISGMQVSPGKVAGIKKRFGCKHIVFSMGRLTPYKGYEHLIDSAVYLGDDYVVLIAGSGALEKELSRRIRDRKLTGKVHMLGRIEDEDVGSYFEASDVFCLSSVSKNEAFGIVQVEAMLFRKPVVSTNIRGSGVTYANVDGETGLVVEPRDPRALADAVKRICGDPDLYRRLAEGGHRRASEIFTTDNMLDSTLEVYRQVLKNKNR
jgi:rhamnosyl/mannosyltransferase